MYLDIYNIIQIPEGGNNPNLVQPVNAFKQNMIYKFNGIQFNNKKQQSTNNATS